MKIQDLLPWRSQKIDYTEAVLLPLQLSGPTFNRSFTQAVANSYQMNSVAHRAIKLVAENMSAIPWLLYQGDEIVDRHWVLDSLKVPNPNEGGRMFKQAVAADLVTAGEVFILKVQPRENDRAELYTLRPDYVKVHNPQRVGDPPIYEYQPAQGQTSTYTVDDVLHIHNLDPLRTGRGFSSIFAAAVDLDQSNLGGKWNVSLLQNGGRPSFAVIAKSSLTTEQRQMLRDSVETLHSGAGNAGRVAVFSGTDMEIRDLGFSPKDMDWKEGINEVNARIATALGVPPEMLNLGDVSYQNKAQAKRSLYEDVIVPMFSLVTEALNGWLVPDGFELRGHYEKIQALQPNRVEEYARLDKSVVAGWLTINDAREEAGYDPDPDFGDLYKWQADAIAQSGRQVGGPVGPVDVASVQKKSVLRNERDKELFWKAQDERKKSYEAMLAADLRKYFAREGDALMTVIEPMVNPEEVRVAIGEAFDPDELTDVLEPAFSAVMADFGDATLVDLGVKSIAHKQEFEDIFGNWVNEVLTFIKNSTADSVRSITDSQRAKLQSVVERGIRDGTAIDGIKQEVGRVVTEQIIPNRSEVIARTEVIRASNAGSFHAAQGTGLPVVRSWISTRDGRARPAHLAAETNSQNQNIPLDQPFVVMGEELMYPGDPSGSAANTIQCRCTTVQKVDTRGFEGEVPPPDGWEPEAPGGWNPVPSWSVTYTDIDDEDQGAALESYTMDETYARLWNEAVAANPDDPVAWLQENRSQYLFGESGSEFISYVGSNLQKAAMTHELGEDMEVYRGFALGPGMIPNDPASMIGTSIDLGEGGGFASGSLSRLVADEFASDYAGAGKQKVMVVIEGRAGDKGLRVLELSEFPEQREILFPAGTKGVISGAERLPDGTLELRVSLDQSDLRDPVSWAQSADAPPAPVTETRLLDEPELTAFLDKRFSPGKVDATYSEDEINALNNYAADGYHALNAYLRYGGTPESGVAETALELDSVFEADYSRVGAKGYLYRGYRMRADEIPDDLDVLVGEVITDDAFMSTTTSLDVARSYAGKTNPIKVPTVLSIRVDEDTPGIFMRSMSQFPIEREVLLPRGTSLEIIGAERRSDAYRQYIQLEAIVVEDGA